VLVDTPYAGHSSTIADYAKGLPAWITLPITSVPILAGSSFERASTARITVAPSSVAGTDFRLASNVLIAVRSGAHSTVSRIAILHSLKPTCQ
jgi:hypothetical protein